MPGKRITCMQIGIYMENRKENKTQKVAAAKAGFSERSARNIKKRDYKEARKIRDYRTRKDPFDEVWSSELKPMLKNDSALQGRTLLEYLQNKYEGKYPESLLRTLQRRIQDWKALEGPSKEVIFRQEHRPGYQGLSDFTEASSLAVTIKNQPFEHRFYHYRLAYSRWSYIGIVQGGESYSALASGLQSAFWESGGVPETHRTDSLSAAYKNCSDKEKEGFRLQYQDFCKHYGVVPTRNNKGVSHENGSVEVAHSVVKSKIDQQLRLRGSRNFDSIEEYRRFVVSVVAKENSRIMDKFEEEKIYLKPLPTTKTDDYSEEIVRVTNTSIIKVRGVIYSVPSRLIGQKLKVRIYDSYLECYVGINKVERLNRIFKRGDHKRIIDYKHLVNELLRKPASFENYVYRDAFFPTEAFRFTWEHLREKLCSRAACKEYLLILKEASKCDRESIVSKTLQLKLKNKEKISSEDIRRLFKNPLKELPELSVEQSCLDDYMKIFRRS